MKTRDLAAEVEALGWVREPGKRTSHRQYSHPTLKGKLTISGHDRDDVPPGTLASIRRQAKGAGPK